MNASVRTIQDSMISFRFGLGFPHNLVLVRQVEADHLGGVGDAALALGVVLLLQLVPPPLRGGRSSRCPQGGPPPRGADTPDTRRFALC